MKKLSLVSLITLFAIASFAQDKREERKEKRETRRQKINELVRQAEEGVLVYRKQNIFGVQLRTNGYGAFYEIGRMKTNRKTNIYRIDICEVKDHKEEKQVRGNGFLFGNPFIYGKINYFYPVTLGFGQQYILGQKGNKNGVAVALIYNAGVSLGLLRPYYVDISDGSGQEKSIKYEEDSASFVDFPISSSGLGKGWSEIKVKPGGFAKVAMRFDYGRFNESVTALEIGMSLDAYASKIPIMLDQKESRLFFQAYVSLLFGKRK